MEDSLEVIKCLIVIFGMLTLFGLFVGYTSMKFSLEVRIRAATDSLKDEIRELKEEIWKLRNREK